MSSSVHWTAHVQTLVRELNTLVATRLKKESVAQLSDTHYESLYNTVIHLSALSSEMIQHMDRTRDCTPLKKRKRVHGGVDTQSSTRACASVQKSGYCDGCQRFLTGAQARVWHNCAHDTKPDTYRRMCDACYARYKRLKKRQKKACARRATAANNSEQTELVTSTRGTLL